jgi:hypothetical protein
MPTSNHRPIPELTEKQKDRFFKRIGPPDENGCRPWLGALDKDGYGVLGINYKNFRAIRVAYFLATGEDPGDALILHSCDNPTCCEGKHLSAGTQKQNQEFRLNNPDFSGENHPRARLTQAEADEIRAMDTEGIRLGIIAEKFGVTTAAISMIVRGEHFKLTADPKRADVKRMAGERHPGSKANDAIVRFVRFPNAAGLKHHQIAARVKEQFGVSVSTSTICLILKRRIWKHVV